MGIVEYYQRNDDPGIIVWVNFPIEILTHVSHISSAFRSYTIVYSHFGKPCPVRLILRDLN